MSGSFTYVSYIRCDPETLWLALTEPVMTQQWWGLSLHSDWNDGSSVDFEMRDVMIHDDEQVVLEAIPFQRLSFTWHSFTHEWAQVHNFSEEMRANFAAEARSSVHFDLEQMATLTRLEVLHDGFALGSDVLDNVRRGWPVLVSSLKSFLETGEALAF